MATVRRFDLREALRPALRSIPEYAALEDLDAVARQYGVDPATVVKIDGNENPYGPSPKALAALRGDYEPHRYPDADQRRLRAAISKYLDVPMEAIVITPRAIWFSRPGSENHQRKVAAAARFSSTKIPAALTAARCHLLGNRQESVTSQYKQGVKTRSITPRS